MPDLGLEVLLKGKNAVRLLGGLWVALRVSLISVAISIPLGILLGVLMTRKNRLVPGRSCASTWRSSALCRRWYCCS